MSLLISRIRGLVAILAALAIIVVPIQVSAATAATTSDTSLSVFTVNGSEVSDGGEVSLLPATTSVVVQAVPTDPSATVAVSGAEGLVTGDNPLNVTVTSSDASATKTYTVNLSVQALSSDTSLKTLQVNGVDVVDGEDVYLPALTENATILVETNDSNATFVVQGGTDLVPGQNIVTITVTAVDGTVDTITFSLFVVLSSDTSLATFQVDGDDVLDGDVVELPALTSEVDVLVETTDPDATYVITGDTALVPGENLLSISVVAADGETQADYFITLNVALNTDASVLQILVEGTEVVDGEVLDLEPGTDAVQVDVETADPEATVEITGNIDLVPGENTLSILVTAADQLTTAEYVITLNLLRNDDVTLAAFEVNGEAVEDGSTVDVAPLTTEVDVFVETTDENATFELIGNEELLPGVNELVLYVTAADGVTVLAYTVFVNVLPNNDASADISVNGNLVADGDVLEFEWGTTDLEVDVLTIDSDATFTVTGDSGLITGDNELQIVVTAADGETSVVTTVTIKVLANTDVSLATFQVNGVDVIDGDSVEVEPGSTAVEVIVETNDPEATYEISGDSELIPGTNDLVVTVTAADQVTIFDYLVSVIVPLNDDTSLSVFTVDGSEVQDGDVVELAPYTNEVEVVAEASDEDASVSIEGALGLVAGENTLTVTVTAADGEASETYTVTLLVALGDDTSLATFSVNGEDVEDGATVSLAPGSTDVELIVETTDPDATYEVAGDQDLFVGVNELLIIVTAANGDIRTYVVLLEVTASDDASVSSITVNDEFVSDGDILELENGTTDVEVVVETTDEDATVAVTGAVGLVTGENTLTILVTAADGETTQEYSVTLVVLASSVTTLETFQVDGFDVADGDVIDLDFDTTEVGVTVETTDPDATFEIVGDTELLPGSNTLEVRVTAADGVTLETFIVTLLVAVGSNIELSTFTVNGAAVEDGDIVDLEPGTSDVDVVVETADPLASFVITGDSGLIDGDNPLTVTVTSADGNTVYEYTITLVVLPSNDTSLATFTVNGSDVADGDTVDLEPGATDVDVDVETTDPDATIEILGDSDLSIGENTLTVTVTAADGETVQVYTLTLVVPDGTNTELAVFTINGVEVVDGDVFEVDKGETFVVVEVETVDPAATFEISGGEDLVTGENPLVVTVTSADGSETTEYTVILLVPSSDTSLTSLLVDGLETSAGDVVTVASDATSVDVEVTPTNENATFFVTGADDLQPGENTVTVTVTAQDGTQQAYVFTVRVGGASSDTALTSLTVNGTAVVDGQVINLPSRTTAVNVVAVTRDSAATVRVNGRTGLVVGENTVEVVVTAGDLKTTRVIRIKAVVAPLSSNNNLAQFTVNGLDALAAGTLQLEPLTRTVNVVAKTEDIEATTVVTGRTDLKDGSNTLTVVVTAANGSTRTYTVTLFVRQFSTDTSLKTLTVDGKSPVNGSVTVAPAVASVTVVAETTDSRAKVAINGASSVRVGTNLVTVLVTAENGSTRSYQVSVVVPASNNVNLKSLNVNGKEYADGAVVELPRGTKAVSAKAVTDDPQAKVLVTGFNNLVDGDNSLNAVVTAADGLSTKTYKLTLRVTPPSSVKTLKSLKVNGTETAFQGATVTVPALTTSVTVEAITTDPEAVVAISGKDNLVEGSNTLSITVTAADKSTATYAVSVQVLKLSSDNSTKTITVNNQTYTSGSVNVPFGTKSVPVTVVTNDSSAKVAIIGNTVLKTGENRVSIRVTAANGASADTNITVVVARSSNTDLSALFVNGLTVTNGAVTLAPRTSAAVVKAVPVDPEATVAVSGTSLVSGLNTVSVTVTAPDGSSRKYDIAVTVTPLSSNTALSVLKVAGNDVVDGGTVNVAYKTTSVPVIATAVEAEATVTFAGSTSLRTGSNTVSVTVTAPSGAKKVYSVTVVVARSSNTDLSALFVNGLTVTNGAVTLAPRTSAAVVKAVPVDPEATVAVSGTSLVSGLNTVSVTVTAPDGSSRKYDIAVTVTPLSSNNSLKSLKVNDVDYVADSTLTLALGAKSAIITAEASDAGAKVEISGNAALIGGLNTANVKVTAANGSVRNYSVKLSVPVRSSNANISTVAGAWTINGIDVADPATVVELPAGVTAVTAAAKPVDSKATLAISGASGLITGADNTVTFRVTAEDGVTVNTYSRTVRVKALSSNTNLSSLTIAGESVVDGGTINVPTGTNRVSVIPVLESDEARFAVSGNTGLSVGSNTVTVRVTAPSGAFSDYAVTVIVATAPSDTTLKTFTVNGTAVTSGATVSVAAGTTRVSVSALPNDQTASVSVTGKSGLRSGSNTLQVTVKALSGDETTYTVTVNVGN